MTNTPGYFPAFRSRTAIVLCLLFIASRIFIFLYLIDRGSDIYIHRGYAEKVVAGQLPFRDFPVEYPPLTFAVTLLPALVDPSLNWYDPLFRAICCLVDCGIWIAIVRANQATISQSLLYLVCTTALGPLIYDRVDIVLGGLLLIAFAALIKERKDTFHLALGFAIAFKLIPVVLVPAVLAAQWNESRRQLWKASLLLSLPTLLSFGAMFLLGGDVLYIFQYHAQRGIQIESVPASLAMFLMMFGMPAQQSFSYGANHIATPYDAILITTGTVLLAVVTLGSAWLVLRRKPDRLSLAYGLLAILTGAMICSKVLSPQYFVFLIPLLAHLPPPADKFDRAATWLLVATLCGVTAAIFPWNFGGLVALDLGMRWMLILRNAGLTALFVALVLRATAGPRVREDLEFCEISD